MEWVQRENKLLHIRHNCGKKGAIHNELEKRFGFRNMNGN